MADENKNDDNEDSIVALAIDRLAVNLRDSIVQLIPCYNSTEINPKLAFDMSRSIDRGRRIMPCTNKCAHQKTAF